MLLIKNAHVYTPKHLGKMDVLISYGQVAALGEHIDPSNPLVTEIIDASDKMLVPGFIDQHVHVIGGGGECSFNSRTPELSFSETVLAGVTTLVGLLGTDAFTRSVEGLVAKTKALNLDGITAYCLTSAYQYPPVTLTGSVGKDIVYIDPIIGCKLAMSDNRGSHPTKDEIIRLVSEIRMAALVSGKPGLLHIHIGATPSGIDSIIDIVRTTDIPIRHFRPTHMMRHFEQSVEFTKMGGYVDITSRKNLAEDFIKLANQADPSLLTISSDSNGSMPRWDENHQQIIGMGVGRMTSLYESVREMTTNYNIPLEDSLPYITENVAKALELYPRKGTIAPGSDADLVILDKDYNIDGVIAKGQKLMMDKIVLVKGMYEN